MSVTSFHHVQSSGVILASTTRSRGNFRTLNHVYSCSSFFVNSASSRENETSLIVCGSLILLIASQVIVTAASLNHSQAHTGGCHSNGERRRRMHTFGLTPDVPAE